MPFYRLKTGSYGRREGGRTVIYRKGDMVELAGPVGPQFEPVAGPAPLLTNGPTLEQYMAAGYSPAGYPPEGYAEVASDGLSRFRATGSLDEAPAGDAAETPPSESADATAEQPTTAPADAGGSEDQPADAPAVPDATDVPASAGEATEGVTEGPAADDSTPRGRRKK